MAIFLSLSLISCNKPDPKPELRDPIFQDMLSEIQTADKNIAEAEKKLAEFQAELSKVKPQTGQNKYAEKRAWQAQKNLDLFSQQKKYWVIRSQERLKSSRHEYLRAFNEKRAWPDPKEFEEYAASKRLRQSKGEWSPRNRIQEYNNSKGASSAPIGPAKE